MFDSETLKELLARQDLSARQKLLVCLAAEPVGPRATGELRELAIASGLRAARNWNVSDYLSKLKPFAVRTSAGWELTESGRKNLLEVVGPILPAVTPLVISALRNQLPTIGSPACQAFVEEAIKAFEAKLYRSAIVLAWVGAVAVLYDHVVTNTLAAFNAEASRRDSKWRVATTSDDLARMKEHEFLQVLAAISLIGKNVKDELEVCLKLRNGCGHPNSLVVGEHKASAHIETLIQNVFAKF